MLKVAGSNKDLPARRGEGEGEEIGTTFHTQEIQEYCLPDKDQHLFRLDQLLGLAIVRGIQDGYLFPDSP